MENKNKPPGGKEFVGTSTHRERASNAAEEVPCFESTAWWNYYKHLGTNPADERRIMPERYFRVDVQFRNGASESFDAKEFNIDVSNIGLGAEAERQADHLIRFSYTGRSGEEVPLYLVPAQVAGIVVEERYSGGS